MAMNSVVLFICGIVLGVLISLSIVSRGGVNNSHVIDIASLSSSKDGFLNTVGLKSLEGENALQTTEHPTSSITTIRTQSQYAFDTKTNDNTATNKDISNPIIDNPSTHNDGSNKDTLHTPPRARWVPGKETPLAKMRPSMTAVDSEQAQSTTSVPGGEDGAAAGSSLEERMTVGQLKRRHRQGMRLAKGLATADSINAIGDAGLVSAASVMTPKSATLTVNASLPRVSPVPNPLIPYHSQAGLDHKIFRPHIPSLETVTANKATAHPLPDMRLQRGAFERENLKLHLCNGVFEAYSASYLTTKAHMLNVASEGYNLSWVNCEMASFIHMKESNKFYANPHSEGLVMQSLDVLDFSVIHLSAFERSSKRYKDTLWKTKKERDVEWTRIEPVKQAGIRLAEINNPALPSARKINYSPEARRTVVIMPFLGGAMGAGHSELGNRFEYLKTCFWSFYEFVPNIVAGVTRQEDVDWCMKESGLPFYDAILLPNLPKPAGLPVGTTQQTKLRLQDGRWDFDYVFFTESDQILISRELQLMYEHLKRYPGHMVLPHRLMPYSARVASEIHKRNIAIPENQWMNQSCCLPRQNCIERKTWLPIKDNRVPFVNYYGLYVPLGNVNFLDEQFRSCKLTDYVGEYCP